MFLTGVIGYPLKFTLSPLLHNNGFMNSGLEGFYYALSVPEKDLGLIIKTLKRLKFTGFNVTNPFKTKILKYLDGLSSIGKMVGAVNTVSIKKDKMFGYNTDTFGFYKSLMDYKINLIGSKVLIIGAGGVARAIIYVIHAKKPESLFITNRTTKKAVILAEKYKAIAMDLKKIPEILSDMDVVINATSVDMQKTVIPYLKNGSVYYDTNYCFPLLFSRDVKIVNGISMLLYQAAYSFSIWTRKRPPLNIMRRTLKEVQID